MFNKYLLFAVISLSMICLTLYNLWDNTKMELKSMKAEKIILESSREYDFLGEKICEMCEIAST